MTKRVPPYRPEVRARAVRLVLEPQGEQGWQGAALHAIAAKIGGSGERRRDPARLPARARRDEALRGEIRRVWAENFPVCGVRKVWRRRGREGIAAARGTTARLMRQRGLSGAIRGTAVKTTLSNPAAPGPRDQSLPRRKPG